MATSKPNLATQSVVEDLRVELAELEARRKKAIDRYDEQIEEIKSAIRVLTKSPVRKPIKGHGKRSKKREAHPYDIGIDGLVFKVMQIAFQGDKIPKTLEAAFQLAYPRNWRDHKIGVGAGQGKGSSRNIIDDMADPSTSMVHLKFAGAYYNLLRAQSDHGLKVHPNLASLLEVINEKHGLGKVKKTYAKWGISLTDDIKVEAVPNKKRTKSKTKKQTRFGMLPKIRKIFQVAFVGFTSLNTPTLESVLPTVFGADWKDYDFKGMVPHTQGIVVRKIPLDLSLTDSMIKRAIANGYRNLLRCADDATNARPELIKLLDEITLNKVTLDDIRVALNSWGIKA